METSWKITREKIDGAHAGIGTVFVQPREAVDLILAEGISDLETLATFVAVGEAESLLGEHAWHDNLDADGNVTSRDVGWLQVSILAKYIGTTVETDLYDRANCARAAVALYRQPWPGGIRRFQPWAAFNSGVYLHDPYAGKGALAVCNHAVERFNAAGATLPLPLFSTADLRAKLAKSGGK